MGNEKYYSVIDIEKVRDNNSQFNEDNLFIISESNYNNSNNHEKDYYIKKCDSKEEDELITVIVCNNWNDEKIGVWDVKEKFSLKNV